MNALIETWLGPLNARWQQLGQREQLALRVLAMVVALLAFWLLLIQPIRHWQQNADQQLSNAQATYQSLLQKAPQAMSSGLVAANPSSDSLNTELRRQANRFGLTIQGFEPDGDLLRVRLDDARYSQVVQWLAALQAQGVTVDQLTLNGRDQPGRVQVLAVLRR
ncbi:type II secretion system protein GspM [Saccharospirillum mangrovi]|uniref:type II secretion system protein GspM n=1 Tax=Saccharospirillum mangrovi TaxID=2161747 RepID=UPI000D39F105|nr:type II secretion system protein M [Saccharospirillum mangrovi]